MRERERETFTIIVYESMGLNHHSGVYYLNRWQMWGVSYDA